jgi:hypothetical protein
MWRLARRFDRSVRREPNEVAPTLRFVKACASIPASEGLILISPVKVARPSNARRPPLQKNARIGNLLTGGAANMGQAPAKGPISANLRITSWLPVIRDIWLSPGF